MKSSFKKTLAVTAATAILSAGATTALARDHISAVGSSTVYPFATVVAERVGKSAGIATPTIESTGTGGGMKLFCAGAGVDTPDLTNASRRIKSSEFKMCQANGVKDIVEILIGYDGIVLANSVKSPVMDVSRRDIYLALAKQVPAPNGEEGVLVDNPYQTWKDVNPTLPNVKIEVLGPPPTSGTRDAFAELALEGGCKTFEWIEAMEKTDSAAYKAACHAVREDGHYIEAGENDNLIVQKLEKNPDAFGVFGFSYLDQNSDMIQGSHIEGVAPTFESIADKSYPVSRPLFFYVKKSHVGVVPGIPEYIAEFTSEKAWGPEGYLADKGMIPLADDLRSKGAASAKALTPMTGEGL